MEEGKGEGGRQGGSNGGQAFAKWESGWCAKRAYDDTSVIMTGCRRRQG